MCLLSPPPPHLSWSCDPQIENNLTLLEEKAEKDLAAIFREKESLQRRVLELRCQLLLQQKHQELATILDAQVGLSMLLRPGVHEGARIRMPPLAFFPLCLGSCYECSTVYGTPVSATQCAESLAPASFDVPPWSLAQQQCPVQGRSEGVLLPGGWPMRLSTFKALLVRVSTVCLNSVPFCLQMEVLGPFQAVAKHFKEQYKTLATALDTTRHELPVQAIHMQGSGQELLGRNSLAVWHCLSRKAHMHHILGASTLEPMWNK